MHKQLINAGVASFRNRFLNTCRPVCASCQFQPTELVAPQAVTPAQSRIALLLISCAMLLKELWEYITCHPGETDKPRASKHNPAATDPTSLHTSNKDTEDNKSHHRSPWSL